MQTTSLRSLLERAAFALAIVVCAVAPQADAATINHGMFMGTEVAYINVTETSDDPLPLYGAPVITNGNVLSFINAASSNPSLGFSAQSAGGVGDITDGFLDVMVMAKPGFGLSSLTFSEGGDYTLAALGPALAQVSAGLIVFDLSIVEVDNVPLDVPIVLQDTQSVTFNLPGSPTPGIWSLTSVFNLDAALEPGFLLGATKVTAQVNNTLTALSQPGSVANIVKKGFDIVPETRVPEPTTLALAVFGLVGMLAKRRTA